MSSGSKKMATRNIATTIVARSSLTKKAIMVNKADTILKRFFCKWLYS
jgi:hypothetical protein